MVSKVQFEKIALSFDAAEKGTSYGHPAIVVTKKFFTRHRKEDNSAVLFVGSLDEREMLMEVEPDIFHVTAHYKDYPIVLARLDKIDAKTLKGMLARRWQQIAPKKHGAGAKKARPEKKAKPASRKREVKSRGRTPT